MAPPRGKSDPKARATSYATTVSDLTSLSPTSAGLSPRARSPKRQYRSSQPFEYSTARPSTGFSVQSGWSERSPTLGSEYESQIPHSRASGARLVRQRRRSRVQSTTLTASEPENPFDITNSITDAGYEAEYTGPLYHRSDWGSTPSTSVPTSGLTPASGNGNGTPGTAPPTAWSRSSYAPTPGQGGIPPLPSPYGGGAKGKGRAGYTPTPKKVDYAYDQGMVMSSPGEITPGTSIRRKDMGTPTAKAPRTAPLIPAAPRSPTELQSSGTTKPYRSETGATQAVVRFADVRNEQRATRQSTLPSVLDFDHLAPQPGLVQAGHSPGSSPTGARFTGGIRAPSPMRSVSPAMSSGALLPPSMSPSTVLQPDRDPFADPEPGPVPHGGLDRPAHLGIDVETGPRQRSVYAPVKTPDFTKPPEQFDAHLPQAQAQAQAQMQPRLLTPEEQRRLGRMSVATAAGPMDLSRPLPQHQHTLLSPTKQNRLGRMSVAPPRYTLPPQRRSRRHPTGAGFEQSPDASRYHTVYGTASSIPTSTYQHASENRTRQRANPSSRVAPSKSATVRSSRSRSRSGMARAYLTYRPFISPMLTLTCALLLTVSHGVSDSDLGTFLRAGEDVFSVSRAGGVPVNLGVWGWCQAEVNDPQCQLYTFRDFANEEATFTIPGEPTLDNLSSLLTAHTVLTWLLASFQIVTAFLHFYLFFALSIPFSHLVDIAAQPSSGATTAAADKQPKEKGSHGRGVRGNDPVVAEVDMRIKCQRIPYEGYEWVWWAWWGHRRSPLAPLFGVLVSISGAVTFATIYMFKRAITSGTGSQDLRLGQGAYVPILTVALTIDTFVVALGYLCRLFTCQRANLRTFLHPPDPSPTVLLLPASDARPMQHHRHTDVSSFFAPRQSDVDNAYETPRRAVDTYLDPSSGKPETLELDAETIRWLAAYPSDQELVPLISDLRQGRINDDFLLSDVGLLYLRPVSEEDQALLVPPKGVIRTELVEDAHFDVHTSLPPHHSAAQGAHNPPGAMLELLSQTFWWNDMASDVDRWAAQCPVCTSRQSQPPSGHGRATARSSAVPWTGIVTSTDTGLTHGSQVKDSDSLMAAEMAYAMRKAQEDAGRA